MRLRYGLLTIVAAPLIAALASGCRNQAFEPAGNLSDAQYEADLVVSGQVTAQRTIDQVSGDQANYAGAQVLDVACASEQEATISVEKTFKGMAPGNTFSFRYFEPCVRPEVNVPGASKTSALQPGDNVTVYLQNHDGQWRMIGHHLTATAGPRPDEEQQTMIRAAQ